jgi:hypothetical protein
MSGGNKSDSKETTAKKKFSRRDFLAAGGVAAAAPAFITAATSSTAVAAQNFGDRFDDAVNFVTARGLMDGSAANFNPDANVDRATAVTALYRIAGSPPVTYGPVFNDVPAGQWYSNAAIWADETEIIAGFGDGRFGPNDYITRQQFAAMLFRHADIKFPQISELDGFTDGSDVSEWAVTGMSWCLARGLIAGTTPVALTPNGNLTRAQFAAMLKRFVNLREDPGNIWVLNPKPTKPPVETPGLAPRVSGGWAGRTVVAMSNYNAHVSNPFGAAIEAQIKATLSAGETVRLIYIGDLTVIRFQRITPSPAPGENWEYMGYEAFLAEVEAGTIKPDAFISAGGF